MSETIKQTKVDREMARHMKKGDESLRSFTEKAVDNQLMEVRELTKGYDILPTLINKLNNIDRINESLPSMNLNIKLDSNRNVKHCSAECSPDHIETIEGIATAADIDHAEVLRICILFELEDNDLVSRIQRDPDMEEIQRQADFVRAETVRIESEFHETLYRLFRQCQDTTRHKIERSTLQFNRFASTYVNEFYASTLYTDLTDTYGPEAFHATERFIVEEETTPYEFDGTTEIVEQRS